TSSIELLRLTTPYLDLLFEDFIHINIVDVGVGNCLPVRKLLEHFLEQGKLARYIGIDVSSDMIEFARRNIELWFGDKITFEGYVRDFSHERFRDILLPEILDKDE